MTGDYKICETANGLKYTIQVPSKDRSENMETILTLLPDANIYVDQDQFESYELCVHEGQLHTHPPFETMPHKRNWMLDQVHEHVDAVVQCDDDFLGFWRLIGKQRLISDPNAIRGFIENQMHVMQDLKLGVGCWSRTRKQMKVSNSNLEPFGLARTPMAGIFILMNDALHKRRFDPMVAGRADVDFALTTLLEDRIYISDMRLYGEFGKMLSSSAMNAKKYLEVQDRMQHRWAKSLKFRDNEGKNQSTQSIVMDVKRRNNA